MPEGTPRSEPEGRAARGSLAVGVTGLLPIGLAIALSAHLLVLYGGWLSWPFVGEVGVLEVTVVFGSLLLLGNVLAIGGGALAFIRREVWAAALGWIGVAFVALVWIIAT